jgi:hypothetical protein
MVQNLQIAQFKFQVTLEHDLRSFTKQKPTEVDQLIIRGAAFPSFPSPCLWILVWWGYLEFVDRGIYGAELRTHPLSGNLIAKG